MKKVSRKRDMKYFPELLQDSTVQPGRLGWVEKEATENRNIRKVISEIQNRDDDAPRGKDTTRRCILRVK